MNPGKLLLSLAGMCFIMIFAVGCGVFTSKQEPTSTPTHVPPTVTPTHVPPTVTPTLEPLAQVIYTWIEAWNNKDIDAFMALVADDAVLDRGPYGVTTGKEAIRTVALMEMAEGLKAKVSKFTVEGNQVTYFYEVYMGGSKVDQGMGVAIIENGKIKSDLPVK